MEWTGLEMSTARRHMMAKKRIKMTQHDLAKLMNVTHQMISLWETGRAPIGVEHWRQLDEIFKPILDDRAAAEEAAIPKKRKLQPEIMQIVIRAAELMQAIKDFRGTLEDEDAVWIDSLLRANLISQGPSKAG